MCKGNLIRRRGSGSNPCNGCSYDKQGSCSRYKSCSLWRDLYMDRQKKINAYAEKVLPAYYAQKEKENEKPCLICTKVKDPENCEIKSCQEWQKWFIERWEELRNGK